RTSVASGRPIASRVSPPMQSASGSRQHSPWQCNRACHSRRVTASEALNSPAKSSGGTLDGPVDRSSGSLGPKGQDECLSWTECLHPDGPFLLDVKVPTQENGFPMNGEMRWL